MASRALILGLLLCFTGAFAVSANAAYVNAAPPAGFGGSPGAYTYRMPANDATYHNGGFRAPGPSVNVGGRMATLPAAYRFGANAGRYAAGALWGNPVLGAGAVLAGWLAAECLKVSDGAWTVTCGPGTPPQSDGYEYRARFNSSYPYIGWTSNKSEFGSGILAQANDWASSNSEGRNYHSYVWIGPTTLQLKYTASTGSERTSNQGVERRSSSCPNGYYITDQGCTSTFQPPHVSEEEFRGRVEPLEIPANVPAHIPGAWPIEAPVLLPDTGNPPQQRPDPMFVPTGLPVPAPAGSPQPYVQPGVNVMPAPTPTSPFRIDVTPVDLPQSNPDPLPDPVPIGAPGGAGDGAPPPQSKFCEDNPESLVCSPMGALEPEEIPGEERELQVSKDGGWQENGSCPAPRQVALSLGTFAFSYQPLCDFATGIRPVIIGFAWLSAALTFFGFAKNRD